MSFRLRLGALAAHGDLPALVSRTDTVSYAELAMRAGAIGDELARLGVHPGDRVALLSTGRAHDEPIGLAGLLAHGCAVVPLDATHPPGRLATIARSRGVRAIVIDEASAAARVAVDAAMGEARPAWITLDAEGRHTGTEGDAPEADGADPEIACVLHTSGSTGAPKPVPITWAGLDAFTAWMIETIALGPSDRVLRVAELVFDLAWFDHVATLRAGATLVTMPRRELAAGRATVGAIATLAPTVIYGVPSLFMKLVAALPADAPIAPCPRVVFFAGEVFPPRELRAFAERVPAARLFNLYGPTETNVCTFHEVSRAALDGERETPIGAACPYAACQLVDEATGHVLEGAGTGELFVGGPTTLGGGPYATRDRVERGADGLFYFRGRIDRMVKVRGYRVEPGEVEAALAAHEAVRQAAVVVRDDPRLGKTLRAFVTVRADATTIDRALRIFLAARLPPYMVPERVTVVDELPLTATGKVDLAKLAAEA